MVSRRRNGLGAGLLVAALTLIAVSCSSESTTATETTTSSVPPEPPPETTTTTTTEPEPEPEPEPIDITITEVIDLTKLTIHVDPAALELVHTQAVVNVIADIITKYPLTSDADVVLFATGDESTQWAIEKTREVGCLHYADPEFYRWMGWAGPCGFNMRVDGMALDCGTASPPCKNGLTVAAHEFFHVIQGQRLEPCVCQPLIWGNKVPNWFNEGLADYVGYATTFGSDPDWLSKSLSSTFFIDRARVSDVATDLIDMERLWALGPSQPWFAFLYERSFFAVALLIEQFGEELVIDTLFDRIVEAGNFSDGFASTFGKTEADFSDEFLEWLAKL